MSTVLGYDTTLACLGLTHQPACHTVHACKQADHTDSTYNHYEGQQAAGYPTLDGSTIIPNMHYSGRIAQSQSAATRLRVTQPLLAQAPSPTAKPSYSTMRQTL